MRRGTLGLIGAAVVLWVGCGLIWVFSPGLTAAYNADYTTEFFARVPGGVSLLNGVMGLLGTLGEAPRTAEDMVARLELGLLVMSVGYALGLAMLRAASQAAVWAV